MAEKTLPKKKKKKVVDPEVTPKKKKKTVTGEDRPKIAKKKKKATSKAIADIAKKKPTKRISKITETGLISLFGEDSEKVLHLIESPNKDSAIDIILTRSMQMLLDVMPYAEHNVRDTKGAKGVYQLKTLVDSVREIIIDLQAMRDRGRVGEILLEQTIRPFMLDLATQVVQRFEFTSRSAKNLMTKDDYKEYRRDADRHLEAIAEYINTGYTKIGEEMKQFLQR